MTEIEETHDSNHMLAYGLWVVVGSGGAYGIALTAATGGSLVTAWRRSPTHRGRGPLSAGVAAAAHAPSNNLTPVLAWPPTPDLE